MPSNCPLCKFRADKVIYYQKKFNREFIECEKCSLVYIDRTNCLNLSEQKSRYDGHNNHIPDPGYISFLQRLINPITQNFAEESKGLDYGSGPYPMLINLFKEKGFLNIQGWDPIYNPIQKVLEDSNYDFITCCEVIEHVLDVSRTFELFEGLMRSQGYLVLSTGLKKPEIEWAKWYYIQDETHINYFSKATFEWIEENFNFKLLGLDKDLAIFSKK